MMGTFNIGHIGRQHRNTVALIWVVTFLLLLATWFHVQTRVTDSRAQELINAERDLSKLTRLSQEHVNRTLRSADQVIRFMQSSYLEIGGRLDLAELTASGVIDSEIFNQVGIINAKGIYILANLPNKTGIDLSDREHFKVHLANDNAGLFVSKPVIGRASGKWSIQLTRRINRPNGDFAGVVVVSIDPGYFTRFYNELNLGAQGLSALYGLDGIARARKVGPKEEFGTVAASAKMFDRMASGELHGSYIQHSVVDGVERIYYFRKVPQYQLAVVTGLDMNDLLAAQRSATRALVSQAAVVSLLLLALAVALTRYLKSVQRDLAARQSAELQIQDRNTQLDAIFSLSPDGFVSFDREHHVKYVNPAFVQMTSPVPVHLQGLNVQEFSAWLAQRSDVDTPCLDLAVLRAKVMANQPDSSVILEVNGNGKRVLKVSLRQSESASVSEILYFRDVTHESEVDQMKSEFLATAAHELRTPMASILGFSEVLLNQEFDPATQLELLGIIHKQSGLMAKILDELLDLARIEARQGKDFVFTPTPVHVVIDQLVLGYKPPKGRERPWVLVPSTAFTIYADSQKMQQAVLQVLSNAYKYSPEGGPVQIEVIGPQGGALQAQWIGIRITDQGIGMTEAQLSRVFERFYRADTSGKILGTGLGMSIVHEIVALHGGKVELISAPGQGTTVTLWMPTTERIDQPGNTT